MSINLLQGTQYTSASRKLEDNVKTGGFKITHYDDAVKLAERAQQVAKYTEVNVWKYTEFLLAFARLTEKVKHEDFLNMLKKGNHKIRRQPTWRHYLDKFSEIISKETGKTVGLY